MICRHEPEISHRGIYFRLGSNMIIDRVTVRETGSGDGQGERTPLVFEVALTDDGWKIVRMDYGELAAPGHN